MFLFIPDLFGTTLVEYNWHDKIISFYYTRNNYLGSKLFLKVTSFASDLFYSYYLRHGLDTNALLISYYRIRIKSKERLVIKVLYTHSYLQEHLID